MSTDANAMSNERDTPTIRKFLFDHSFEGDLALNDPASRTYTLEQLEAAKQEAYENGRKEGRKATMEEQQQHLNALLNQVDKKLGDLVKDSAKQWEAQLVHLQEVGLSIARKIMPSFAERHGLQEIESIIAQVIAEMGREPRLVVRVGETQFDAVNEKIKEISDRHAYAGKVVVLSEPELGAADCRVEWADGGIERDISTLWQEIDRIMERVQTLAPPSLSDQPSPSVESAPTPAPIPLPSQPSDASGEKS